MNCLVAPRSPLETKGLTQFSFLHENLCEGPAYASNEGGQKHHDEALQVELGRLEGEHEQAT